ncbi:hypothetical protein [Saccharothrix sp. Mg75]|uniref:hypothetical protein n=1 Tax=Saccharothrix sp. Mg75 TaxID=3445357 RepID=UPI003EE87B7C
MDFAARVTLLIAILLILFALIYWWGWRRNRRKQREHADALAALATTLGGTVVGRDRARAWTTELRRPMESETGGLINLMGTVRRARFETALDFQRGDWSVRVSEASIEKHVVTASSTIIYEHRIEVATSLLPAMKICRRLHVGFGGRPLTPAQAQAAGPAGEPPATAVRDQLDWFPVRLPEPMNHEFTVFSTDPAAVSRAFTPQVAEWLVDEAGPDLFQGPMPTLLTFESGFAYATEAERIDPDTIIAKVDTIIGLLERLGVKPAHAPQHYGDDRSKQQT